MSKRKCPFKDCCNGDCRQTQKEIIECKRRNKIIGIFDADEVSKLKRQNVILSNTLYNLVAETRMWLRKILIVQGRPVKNTSKKEAYEVLEKLQDLYKSGFIWTDRYVCEMFVNQMEQNAKTPEFTYVLYDEMDGNEE